VEFAMSLTRRAFALGAFFAPAFPGPAAAQERPHVTLYSMPDCGCCIPHGEYLRENGFDVEIVHPTDLASIRLEQSVPAAMQGCHTLVVDGYVVEGHVSADIIKRLLSERPQNVRGISIPGMPPGVPGMPGERDHPLDVYAFSVDGEPMVYAQQP
jgi:hypothetical protein